MEATVGYIDTPCYNCIHIILIPLFVAFKMCTHACTWVVLAQQMLLFCVHVQSGSFIFPDDGDRTLINEKTLNLQIMNSWKSVLSISLSVTGEIWLAQTTISVHSEHLKLQHLGKKLQKFVLLMGDPSPPLSTYKSRHWCHSRDKMDQAFPLHFCILHAIKNLGGGVEISLWNFQRVLYIIRTHTSSDLVVLEHFAHHYLTLMINLVTWRM